MTKKGVMNTLQQHDMPPNMDEGCQHRPLQDQFPVVSSNAVLAFGMIAAHIAGCLVVPSLEAGPEFLLESLHTCSFCHHDLLFFPLPLAPHPTSSLTLSEKDEEILDSPEEEMKTKKKKTLKMNLLNKKSKKIIGSRKM
jgi:hypothetical protein